MLKEEYIKCGEKYAIWGKYYVLYRSSTCVAIYGQECSFSANSRLAPKGVLEIVSFHLEARA